MPRLRNRAGLRVPQRLRDEEVLEDGPERNEEEENQFDHLPDEIDLIELELVADAQEEEMGEIDRELEEEEEEQNIGNRWEFCYSQHDDPRNRSRAVLVFFVKLESITILIFRLKQI